MNVLGVRCSNKDFFFVVLTGTKKSPRIIITGHHSYPRGYAKPPSLKWFYQEIVDLLKIHQIDSIVVKSFEGKMRGKSFEDRVEYEAMVLLAGVNEGLKSIFKKVRSTIAKDIGTKGRPRYLEKLDTTMIPNFDNFPDKMKEAIYAAWSELL